MKYYMLSAVVNGREPKLKRRMFLTRNEAIEYMFKFYEKNYLFNLQVSEEYPVDGDKHNIEYVCNYYTRFTVSRHLVNC